MKDNFLTRMFSNKGDISSKRVITFIFSLFIVWAGWYIVVHYREYALTVFGYMLIMIGLLIGVFTLPEVLSIIKGTPPPAPKDEPKETQQ